MTVPKRQGLIFVISGPSGSGKTTLLKDLLKTKTLKNRLVKSVSLTTRPKRLGERDGQDYFFISEKEFKRKRQIKKLLEWTKYSGYYYGTSRDFFNRQLGQKTNLILCLDLKGALKIKQLYPKNTITIFIMPPSLAALQDRIKQRQGKTKENELKARLRLAQEELSASKAYDYRLVNRDLGRTLQQLKDIILDRISDN